MQAVGERPELYQLMGLLFRQEPTRKTGIVLAGLLVGDYFPLERVDVSGEMGELASSLATSRRQLIETLSARGEEAFAEALGREYYELFFDPAGIKVSLWESSYVNDDQMLFQAPNWQTKESYRSHGFELANANFPGDHLSTELNFLHLLCERETGLGWPEAPSTGELGRILDDHLDFLNEHPLSWLPALCRGLEDSRSTIYLALAGMTLDACRLDAELVRRGR